MQKKRMIMNFIQIMGHLGADAETRVIPSGQKVTNLRIATSVRKGGKEETVWYKVTLWGDRFDKMMPYLKKGSSLIVYGELNKPEIYNDREGRPQISLEITAEFIRFSPFGKGEKTGENRQQESMQGQFTEARSASTGPSSQMYASPDQDDGLPF
jgi:single-strand DNA-binding protein